MKKTIKKLAVIVIAMVMLLGVLTIGMGCSGGDDYVFAEGDFRLTLTADRTEVKMGEEIEFTFKLENLSGRDILARTGNSMQISIALVSPEQTDFRVVNVRRGIQGCMSALDFRFRPNRYAFTIEKDSVVTHSFASSVSNSLLCHKEYIVYRAVAIFDVGRNFNQQVVVLGETIRINIIRGED